MIIVTVYDSIGRLLDRQEIKPGKLTMGNGYPSGIYHVLMTQGKETKNLKVIKK